MEDPSSSESQIDSKVVATGASGSSNAVPEPELPQNVDALARGIASLLTTVIKDFDSRAQDTSTSQDQLSSAIDRLSRELDQLLEDAPLPFILQHAAKISTVRKRVSSLNSVLKSIQQRVDNIDRMLFVGMKRRLLKVQDNIKSHITGYDGEWPKPEVDEPTNCSYGKRERDSGGALQSRLV